MPQLSWSQEKVKIFKYMTNLDTNEDIFDFIKKQIKSQEVDIKRLSYDQIIFILIYLWYYIANSITNFIFYISMIILKKI